MQASDFNQHISRQFNDDLEDVRNRVLEMGGLVEEQIDRALQALVNGDSELGLAVAHDDYKVNRIEVDIDEECTRILAVRAPTASDLRLVMIIIKTIADLERIGDEAEKIGFLASRLADSERPKNNYRELKHLGRMAGQMVHNALDAFARIDAEAALSTFREDQAVDEEYDAISRQGITFMMEDPRRISQTLDALWVARALERIGDHAKNICEYVIYLVGGKDIRHTSIEDAEKSLKERLPSSA